MYQYTRWYRLLIIGLAALLCTASVYAQVDPGGVVTGHGERRRIRKPGWPTSR